MVETICGYEIPKILSAAGSEAGSVYNRLCSMCDNYVSYDECVTYIEAVFYLGCDPHNYGDSDNDYY